ncbi:MAG: PEP-CTERM sorting domain-containing protein [bacterium]|nr:PEP-CTERM sorting domain-containing protein [bacterium]
MKKQFVAALATGIFLVGMTGMANATYIEELDLIKILGDNAYIAGSGDTESWTHTYSFSEPTPLLWATLTIVADDVDPPTPSNDTGELIIVSIFADNTWIQLGELKQGQEYTNWNYKPGYGAYSDNIGNYTTTVFNLDLAWLQPEMEFKVVMAGNYGAEIEKSTLTVQGSPVPVPATAILFGAGLAGLAGIARKRKSSVA